MNYAATYCALISKRLQNPLSKKDCYCETHHIIPKSEGGDDSKDNLVNLTAREHYVAHLLLARIYDDKNMWCAVNRLIHGNDFRKYNRVSSRMYEFLKKNITKKENTPMYGKSHSEETKNKISQSLMGHTHSEQSISKNRISHLGRRYPNRKRIDAECRNRMSERMKGYKWSEQSKKKLSQTLKGHPSYTSGKKMFNNGVVNVFAYECPEGFVHGRLKNK